MCGAWVPFVPFVLVAAYAYWWSNLRQSVARHDGGCVANLIFLAVTVGIILYARQFCLPRI
ncbi:hypothetical protein ABIF62_004169 [Bradyrhizobium japonicum]